MKKPAVKYAGLIAGAILATGFEASAAAEEIVAARNIRAGALIAAEDIAPPESAVALRIASRLVGLEAARSIYKGQPLHERDLKKPTLVERNAVVTMEFVKGPLVIATEGRALDQGAEGDRIRVMNLFSKRVVTTVVVGSDLVRTKQ